jgi:hypothetical protein
LNKRDITFVNDRVIVRPKADDAPAKLRALKLREKLANGARWTEEERDWALLALLQAMGLD